MFGPYKSKRGYAVLLYLRYLGSTIPFKELGTASSDRSMDMGSPLSVAVASVSVFCNYKVGQRNFEKGV